MCTLSFSSTRDGMLLAMNRDESLTREPALAPRVFSNSGSAALYPAESSGGTWLAVNERGLALALLNRNGSAGQVKQRSRGLLIPSLIAAASLQEVEGRLSLSGATGMLPFTLVGFDPAARSILECVWDGQTITADHLPWKPRHWFSSGLSDQQAAAIRGRTCSVFHEHFAATPENLRELHRSHSPGPGAYSICVHRPGVGSVSYSEVVLERGVLTFTYAAGVPCGRPPLHTLALRLAAAGRPAA